MHVCTHPRVHVCTRALSAWGEWRPPQQQRAELVARVRADVGAFANFRRALIVERLPKTRSGKILRTALRRLAAGDHVDPPSTIDDPAILPEIAALLQSAGIAPA